jgi:hypothetical protein
VAIPGLLGISKGLVGHCALYWIGSKQGYPISFTISLCGTLVGGTLIGMAGTCTYQLLMQLVIQKTNSYCVGFIGTKKI